MKLSKREAWAAMSLYGNPEVAGLERPKPKRQTVQREAPVLKAVLEYLDVHPLVAFAVRMNSGAYITPDGRFIRFGFVGCPDILGQMKTGKLLVVECKAEDGRERPEQREFIDMVIRNGGHGGFARSIEDARSIVELA